MNHLPDYDQVEQVAHKVHTVQEDHIVLVVHIVLAVHIVLEVHIVRVVHIDLVDHIDPVDHSYPLVHRLVDRTFGGHHRMQVQMLSVVVHQAVGSSVELRLQS